MNKNLHRIVFNARRGQRMVVAETASSQGKSASGDSQSNRPPAPVFIAQAATNLVALLVATLLLPGHALAQIKADSHAPGTQQATILATANGVPQINIQTPSAAGVSRNVYSQFDVQANGAVLNNSRTGTNSAVGGYVQANPWLTQGTARVILNEVNSTSASQLQGPIEVAGQRAEVVIANPAGIAVNGGSFINASTVTLTTGTPVLLGGALDAYRVQGGSVSVNGHGLDTGGADYTNILARAVQVNAGIWAKELRVRAGVNDTSAANLAGGTLAQGGATSGAAPGAPAGNAGNNAGADASVGFALDVSALGGMYAGKIFLIGLESGMGVRNSGVIAASAGDITLSNNGWLSNSGSIFASGNTRISTQGSQTYSGFTSAQGNLSLSATGADGSITSVSKSVLGGGLKSDGTLTGSGQTTVTAAQGLAVAGNLVASGDLQASGQSVDLKKAYIHADSATITAGATGADLRADNAVIDITKTLNLFTANTLHTDGAKLVANTLNLGAHGLSNVGGTLGQTGSGDLVISLAGDLDNSGGQISGNRDVTLGAANLRNTNKGNVFAAGNLDITASQLNNSGTLYAQGNQSLHIGGDLTNGADAAGNGLIAAQGSTTITTASLHNNAGGQIVAGMQTDGKLLGAAAGAPHLNVNATRSLDNLGVLMAAGDVNLDSPELNLGGSTSAGANMGLHGGNVQVGGSLVSGKNLDVQALGQLNLAGYGQVGGSASINAGSSLRLGGQFTVNLDLGVKAGSIASAPGSLLTVGHNADLNGGASVNLGGTATVGNRLDLQGNSVDLTGAIDAGITAVKGGSFDVGKAGSTTQWRGNLSLDMTGDVNARGGLAVADGASITSGGTVHIGGNAQSGANLDIRATGNVQIDGTVTADKGSALSAGGTLQTGSIQASSVSLDAQQVTVTGSVVGTTGATQLHGTQGITVTGDVTSAGGSGVVAATNGALDIGGATTSSAGISLQAGSTIHLGQQAQATLSLHLDAGGDIVADKGLAAGAVDIKAQNLTVAQNLTSGGVLQAQTHAFSVTGNVLSGGDTQIVATPQAGAVGLSTVHIGGALATNGSLDVQSSGTLQVSGTAQAATTLQLKAQGITLGGQTTSGGNSSIDAQGAALNIAGVVGSGANQSLAGSTISVQGAQALGSMDLSASAGQIDSTSSLLAGTGLTANAAGAITVQGHIAGGGATTLQSTGHINATGTLASGAAGLSVVAGGDIAAAALQSLGDSKLTSTANVTLGNALNIGGYSVTAGGNISQAQVQSGAALSETAGGAISHSGATVVAGNATLSSGAAQTFGNTPVSGLTATGSITATAATGTIAVGSDLLANGSITATASLGGITVGGNLGTQGAVNANAQSGISVGGALTGKSATLGSSLGGVQIASNVQVQTDLSLSGQTNVQAGGTTTVNGTLNATSTTGSVAFGKDLSVGTTTTVSAGNGITLGGNSTLVGAAQLQSAAGTISNQGLLATNQTLTVSGNADLVNHGSMQSVGNMSLTSHNITSNAGAASTITTGGSLTAAASGALNLDSTLSVTAKNTVTLGAVGGGTSGANIQAGTSISLSGGTLTNSGQIASQTVNSSGSLSNTGTVYGSSSVTVGGSTSNSGQIVGNTSLNLGTTSNSGVIQSQTVTLGSTTNGGSIAGTSVSASSLSNQGSVGATNDINVGGDVNNSGAVAANNIFFNGGNLVNSGQVHASGSITINASSVTNTAVVTPPIPGVPENTNVPYASAGAIKADGTLNITSGSLANTGTLSANGAITIAVGGSLANNKRGFILGDSTIFVSANGVSNDGIIYGITGAPSTVTIASTGGIANSATGVVIAGNQLTLSATSFTNAGDNVSSGVGSLGNASLSTTGVWDAGANPLKVNGLLTANTNGITVGVGKTWEQSNVTWGGTLTNYGTTNLGTGHGTVRNESTGGIIRTDVPNSDPALVGSYEYTSTPPAGYTGVTFVGYTDVLNRAQFAAGTFTGGIVNVAGDVNAGSGSNVGYSTLKIDQTTIWSGVPVATPGGTPEQIFVNDSKSIARANFSGTSIVTLVGPSAGTIVGANVTVNAGDLTVDKSNVAGAQGGIASAQAIGVGAISGSPAALAALQNPALQTAAALHSAALQANKQGDAISGASITTTAGTPATLGTAGTFSANNSNGTTGGGQDPTAGTTLPLPAPDLRTVQGAWAELMAHQVAPVLTDWKALNAQAGAINTTNLTLNLTGTLTNGGGINATSTLKITAAGGIDNSAGLLSAGEWVELDSQGLGLINNGGTIQSGGSLKANVTGNVSAVGGHFVSTHSDVVLDASGKLTLTDSSVSAKEGVAHLYGSEGVTIAATQQTKTSVTTQAQFQTVEHAAVAQAGDNDAQAAYTEVIAGSGSTTTTTTTQWADSTVDANKIDIQSSKGGVTIDASDLKAANGIRVSAAQDVKILAQRGVANSATTTSTTSQQSVASGWDSDGTQKQLVTTTTAGNSSNQETLRASSLDAGAGTLSIESTGGNISGQSAQLSGNKILLVTTKTQDGTAFDKADGKPIAATPGGGSIKLESLQVSGKTVGLADASTGTSALTTQTLTTVKGTLTAKNGISMDGNKDLSLGAIAVDAGQGDIYAHAGGNVNLNANIDAEQRNQSTDRTSSSFFTSTHTVGNYQTQDATAAVTTLKGNNITLKAGDNLTNYAAVIDGSGTVMQTAGKSANTFTATQSHSYTEDVKSGTSFMGLVEIGHDNSTLNALHTDQLGSQVFGQKIGVDAKDVKIVGASMVAKDLLSVTATDSMSITAATNTFSVKQTEDKRMLGISANIGSGINANSESSSSSYTHNTTTSQGSTLSGKNVIIGSGTDTTIAGSAVLADKNITVNAGGNVNILAATNTDTTSYQSQSNSTQVAMMAGASLRHTDLSIVDTNSNGNSSTTTHTTSLLSANAGKLTIVSSNKITTQGAELVAKDAVNLTAKSVDLQAVTDTTTSEDHSASHSFVSGSALSGSVGSKITAISDAVQGNNTQSQRLQDANKLKAAYDAYKIFGEGVSSSTESDASGTIIGISASTTISSSKQDSVTSASQARGTSIQAQNISITATDSNITGTGVKLQGKDITLDAARDINLLAAANTSTMNSSNESHSLGGGVTFGVGSQTGISFQASASQANGTTKGSETTYDNSLVTATGTLSVKSGGDTNLVGAQLAGNKVKMDVGGDLNVVTLQDNSNFESKQSSSGISVSVCVPPLCVGTAVTGSLSLSKQAIDHSYQSATGQSGIAAGTEGYDITVKGKTDLVGGAITSKAAEDQNSLKTGSLSSVDLNNQQSTSSSSMSLNLSYSGNGSAMSNVIDNIKSNALANLNPGAGLPANGSQSGVTQSVISKGTVTITGSGNAATDANSSTQVATLTKRDASKANGSLVNTLTLQQAKDLPAQQKAAQDDAQADAALAGVAAGVAQDILPSVQFTTTGKDSTYLDKLGQNTVNAVVTAGVTTLITGKPANLGSVATTVVVSTTAQVGANMIGDLASTGPNGEAPVIGTGTQLAAHAVLGCAAGATLAGNASGCAPGAAGGVTGEVTAMVGKAIGLGDKDAANLATVTSAAVGSVVGGGGNGVSAANIAAFTGANAAVNNYLTHAQALAKTAALEKATTEQDKQTIKQAYDKLDEQQKNEAAACLLKDQCSSVFEKPSLAATLKELNAACAAPRLCTPEEQKSILELKDFYATKEAIKPDTTIEEILFTNKAVTTALNVAKGVIVRVGAEVLTPAAKPLGVVSDFGGNPVAVLEAASQYAFKTEVNIGATGVNLENSAAQFVKDEAGKDFIGVFASKTGNNNGIDLAYAKMVNGQPQLVIGEAKAGDSALTALGENYEKTLTRNLVKVEESIKAMPDSQNAVREALLVQLKQQTYQVELYTSVGNAAKAAARVDDTLIARMGQPVSRIVTFGKN